MAPVDDVEMRDLAKLCALLAVVAVAACGGDSNTLPDGPPGGPDATRTPDAPPVTTATVVVSQENFEADPGAPIEDAGVAVIAPGGGAPVMFTTNATGTATFPVEPGSAVWVQVPVLGSTPGLVPGVGSGSGQLYLITSVSPGDTIALGAPRRSTGSAAGTLTLRYTPLTGSEYGFFHDALMEQTSCYDYGVETVPGTIDFTTYDGCAAPSRELVITAYDLVTGAPAAWLTVPGVAPVPGTIDASTATWDTTGTMYTVNHTGHDAAVYSANTYVFSGDSWHSIYQNGPIDAGTGTHSQRGPTLPTPALAVTQLHANTAMSQYVAEPLATIPASYDIDGSALLPFIDVADYDPATRTITWATPIAGTVAPQIVTSTFSYFDDVDSTQYRWTIYAPGDTTELVLPDVPDVLTTHDLQPLDRTYPDIWLINVEGSSYSTLLNGLDLYRDDPAFDLPATAKSLLSGGYGGGKFRRGRPGR